MNILHILYQSLPNTAGSSIRSRDILESQKKIGLSPIAITAPFQAPKDENASSEIINGIRYYRTYSSKPEEIVSEHKISFGLKLRKLFRIFSFIKTATKIAKDEKIDIVHAHATFFCGITGKIISKKLNKPFVYEVRSLWEERKKEEANFFEKIQLGSITRIETFVMHLADKVVVINKNLYDNILERGIQKEKITIIPNAVNMNLVKDIAIKEIKENTEITFGYIGSISPIEGLELLVKVFALLKAEGYANRLLIFGNGSEKQHIDEIISEYNIDNVELMGSLPSEEIYKAYELIDVIINPRSKSKIADAVTPLKPLEAMGYKKLVIASDVGGMKELIEHNVTGKLFKADSQDDLFQCIVDVIENWNDYQNMVGDGHNYVVKEKSWIVNVEKYKEMYALLSKKKDAN